MTDAGWEALLQSFIRGAIDHTTFHDLFLDAWRAARDRGQPEPDAIADLFFVVEAYTPDLALRGPDDTSDNELKAAAEQTLLRLGIA